MKRLLIVLAISLLPALAAAGELAMAFGETDITVSGLTPGNNVALFGVARRASDGINEMLRHTDFLVDENQDGEVMAVLPFDIVSRSVWIAVEFQTGETVVDSPGDAGIGKTFDPLSNILADETGAYRFVRANRSAVELAVIRSGVGGWHLAAWDGGTGDVDEEGDGVIYIDTTTMNKLANTSFTLGSLALGDVLIGLDPSLLEFYVGPIEVLPGAEG